MDIDAKRIIHLIRCLEERGCNTDVVDKALEKCGLVRRDLLVHEATVEYLKEALFVREACHAVSDVTFGAAAGLRLKDLALNSLAGYIGKYSKDLRATIENTARFHDLIDPALSFSLRVSGNSASIELTWKDPSYAMYHRHTEFLVFGALSRLRSITETNFFPIEVRLDHEVGASADRYNKLVGFPVVFGAEKPEIILPLSSLNIPVPTYDLKLREHLTDYGDRLLKEMPERHPELRSRIVGLITAALPGHMLSAEETSAALGMSLRSFSRRLGQNGLTYRQIVDELRYDLAKTFLRNGMSLSEISFLLGYKDQAAFSSAFKRWSGAAPRTYLVDLK